MENVRGGCLEFGNCGISEQVKLRHQQTNLTVAHKTAAGVGGVGGRGKEAGRSSKRKVRRPFAV